MFNRKVSMQTNNEAIASAHLASLTKVGIQDDVMCHMKCQYCNNQCAMFVPGTILDRRTSNDRYFVFSPYCLLVEVAYVSINK